MSRARFLIITLKAIKMEEYIIDGKRQGVSGSREMWEEFKRLQVKPAPPGAGVLSLPWGLIFLKEFYALLSKRKFEIFFN